ncbi:SRPBCC domain-containing protein [Rugosimonospora acidiphila]|uniref:SRPBCC domain-containing protein n=1 Tax=Rugosimonospora acidiphila TaxID=556531 RepID=A0ABP9RL33_9ACTN
MTIENDKELAAPGVVRIGRTLDAPPARVWRAFTDPDELAGWFWPPSFKTSAALDLRPGGQYRIAASTPEMAVSGEYLEVEPPRECAFAWRWDGDDHTSVVRIELLGDGDLTELRLAHEQLPADAVDAHHQGWSDCLDRLPGHLA